MFYQFIQNSNSVKILIVSHGALASYVGIQLGIMLFDKAESGCIHGRVWLFRFLFHIWCLMSNSSEWMHNSISIAAIEVVLGQPKLVLSLADFQAPYSLNIAFVTCCMISSHCCCISTPFMASDLLNWSTYLFYAFTIEASYLGWLPEKKGHSLIMIQ